MATGEFQPASGSLIEIAKIVIAFAGMLQLLTTPDRCPGPGFYPGSACWIPASVAMTMKRTLISTDAAVGAKIVSLLLNAQNSPRSS